MKLSLVSILFTAAAVANAAEKESAAAADPVVNVDKFPHAAFEAYKMAFPNSAQSEKAPAPKNQTSMAAPASTNLKVSDPLPPKTAMASSTGIFTNSTHAAGPTGPVSGAAKPTESAKPPGQLDPVFDMLFNPANKLPVPLVDGVMTKIKPSNATAPAHNATAPANATHAPARRQYYTPSQETEAKKPVDLTTEVNKTSSAQPVAKTPAYQPSSTADAVQTSAQKPVESSSAQMPAQSSAPYQPSSAVEQPSSTADAVQTSVYHESSAPVKTPDSEAQREADAENAIRPWAAPKPYASNPLADSPHSHKRGDISSTEEDSDADFMGDADDLYTPKRDVIPEDNDNDDEDADFMGDADDLYTPKRSESIDDDDADFLGDADDLYTPKRDAPAEDDDDEDANFMGDADDLFEKRQQGPPQGEDDDDDDDANFMGDADDLFASSDELIHKRAGGGSPVGDMAGHTIGDTSATLQSLDQLTSIAGAAHGPNSSPGTGDVDPELGGHKPGGGLVLKRADAAPALENLIAKGGEDLGITVNHDTGSKKREFFGNTAPGGVGTLPASGSREDEREFASPDAGGHAPGGALVLRSDPVIDPVTNFLDGKAKNLNFDFSHEHSKRGTVQPNPIVAESREDEREFASPDAGGHAPGGALVLKRGGSNNFGIDPSALGNAPKEIYDPLDAGVKDIEGVVPRAAPTTMVKMIRPTPVVYMKVVDWDGN